MILSKKVSAYRLSPFVARTHSVLGGQALIAWSVKLYKRPVPSRLLARSGFIPMFLWCNTLALLPHHGSLAPRIHHSWEYTHLLSIQQIPKGGCH